MSQPSTPAVPRKTAARIAADCALSYLLLVAVCALLRATASFFGRPEWLIESMPWPEVFYGPAIAVGTIFGASRLSEKVEAWLRRRRA